MSDFAARILCWFDGHGRKDLPWQQDINPYRVWISEIMLQQTQVQTVIPYFEHFMQSFPNLKALADAPIDSVLGHWSGLGYYARARNLHKAAQIIEHEFSGKFPSEFDDVVALPGIGRSTAGAILAISLQQRHPILDGNVKRVLARHAAIDGWPGKTDVANALWALAEQYTPYERIADYTQAIMDLGATVCTRSSPECAACPVAGDCQAALQGDVLAYPGRKAKKAKPLRETTMVVAVHASAVYLERRPPAGIWGGLWSLPEVDDVADWCRQTLDHDAGLLEARDTLRHSFSHYDLDIHPVVVHLDAGSRRVADAPDVAWYVPDQEPPGGMAAPVQQIINSLKMEGNVTNS